MIDVYVCMLLLDLKKSGASVTLLRLERKGILQEIPAPHIPSKIYMLTRLGADELLKFIPIHDYLRPVIHPSRINTRQIPHDMLAMYLALRLFKTSDDHMYFFGGDSYYPVDTLTQKNRSFYVKNDTELRVERAKWYEKNRNVVSTPRYAVGKLADALICYEDLETGKILGSCFIELQESYDKSSNAERNLSHYVRLIQSGEMGEYPNGDPATTLIYASTRPEILNFYEKKLENLNEYRYNYQSKRWERYNTKLDVVTTKNGNTYSLTKYIKFIDLRKIKKRYYYGK